MKRAVEYGPHPIWGGKISVLVAVEGLSKGRLKQQDPLTHHSMDEMRELLKAHINQEQALPEPAVPGLPGHIYNSMDF